MSNSIKVQKKKKMNKISPYWVFVCEFGKKMGRKGIYNDNQLKEMASSKWNGMTQEEKNKYKVMAKASEPTLNQKRRIYNTLGQDVEKVEEENQRKKKETQSMKDEVRKLATDANNSGELDDLVIHFINASTFYDDENDVYPAELAMAKFSLKGGITDDIQIRIKPKSLPLGSLLKATEKAEQHKYDLPPNCDGEEDYINILEAMIKFLHPMQKLPIFFTESDNMTTLDQTRRVVEKIFYESQEDDLISELKFYPVSEIFVVLQELTVNNRNRQSEKPLAKFPSIVFAADIMKNKTFLYSTQGCDYHKEKDALENCCKAKVRRYGYKIAEYCSDKIRYQLLEGRHYPDN